MAMFVHVEAAAATVCGCEAGGGGGGGRPPPPPRGGSGGQGPPGRGGGGGGPRGGGPPLVGGLGGGGGGGGPPAPPTAGMLVSQSGASWPGGSREPFPLSAQLARTVGMASSRYHSQNARRADTSVSSTGCQFSAPAAALAHV